MVLRLLTVRIGRGLLTVRVRRRLLTVRVRRRLLTARMDRAADHRGHEVGRRDNPAAVAGKSWSVHLSIRHADVAFAPLAAMNQLCAMVAIRRRSRADPGTCPTPDVLTGGLRSRR